MSDSFFKTAGPAPSNRLPAGGYPGVKQTSGQAGGFTLIEILVAVVIFAVLMTTLFSSFSAFINSASAVKDQVNSVSRIRNATQRILKDLAALYIVRPPRYEKPGFDSAGDPFRMVCDETSVSGSSFSRLRFASSGHISLDGSDGAGIARIVYYVRQSSRGFELCRSDTLPPFPDFQPSDCDPVVCRNITEFEITLFDRDGNDYARWDSEAELFDFTVPVSLDIRIVFNDKETVETGVALPVQRRPLEE
ncbi:MAG: type II secretion system protein [Desulfobacteraceae bacterium]